MVPRSSQRQVERAQHRANRPGCLPASSASSARLSLRCLALQAPQAWLQRSLKCLAW